MKRNAKIGWFIAIAVVVLGLGYLMFRQQEDLPAYTLEAGDRPIKGSAEATILVEEFSDFQCPACKSAQGVVQDVVDTFGDKIAFTYKHFPLSSIHPFAMRAALASECANDQGKFWEYHDLLFANQPNFSEGELIAYAGDLELDTASFTACLKSRARQDIVRGDMREGDRRNVNSTPSFFVNGERVTEWTQLRSIIQGKLIGG